MPFIAVAFALQVAAVPYPADPDCSTYGDGSTVAMVECYGQQSEIWDRRLDDEYRAALQRADRNQIGPLRTAQGLWLQYRAANCEMYASVAGSISRILSARCWRDMSRDRALELRGMSWSG
jgi:uncharacterized protein YecT (DUF1311 family)